jgi:hypothetical protein
MIDISVSKNANGTKIDLQKALSTKPYLDVEPLTIRKSITCLRLKLWDEKGKNWWDSNQRMHESERRK